jgi:hypothetical protein
LELYVRFPDFRRIVAVHARDVVVLGGLPRLVIRLHDVAACAKVRACREFEHPGGEDQKENAEEPEELEEPGLEVKLVLFPVGDVHPELFQNLVLSGFVVTVGCLGILLSVIHGGCLLLPVIIPACRVQDRYSIHGAPRRST